MKKDHKHPIKMKEVPLPRGSYLEKDLVLTDDTSKPTFYPQSTGIL